MAILQPFLALVRSPLTSGLITSVSLSSLHSLILNILPLYLTATPTSSAPATPLQIALASVTSALSQCRFPSSSPQQDELVLLRLLRVIESLAAPVSRPSSSSSVNMLDHMGDESVCELLEVGLGMGARGRLGEGLRNSAQSCVQAIVRVCFVRLRTLSPEEDKVVDSQNAAIGTVKVKEEILEEAVEGEGEGEKVDAAEVKVQESVVKQPEAEATADISSEKTSMDTTGGLTSV
jgi:brefeldin A-resistance guanine nucleotide exchange factor 1